MKIRTWIAIGIAVSALHAVLSGQGQMAAGFVAGLLFSVVDMPRRAWVDE